MDITQLHHQHETAKQRLKWMTGLAIGLLVANGILALVTLYQAFHQKHFITPFSSTQSYWQSDRQVDSHYLQLMAENLLHLRLNVTPETVEPQFKRLLAYAESRYRPALIKALRQEKQTILQQRVSQVFIVHRIDANPKQLTTTIHGERQRWLGMNALSSEKQIYRLTFVYHFGHLTLKRFERHQES